MAGLGDFIGRGSVAEQMFTWGVLNNIVTQVGNPFFLALSYKVNEAFPLVELSPADLAVMVVRNVRDRASAAAEAKRAGIDGSRFDDLVAIAGDAPGPDELAVALRRGLIRETGTGPDSTSFDQGIAEGRLRDKWAPVIKELATQWPTPTDALDARLQGQVDDATGHDLYVKFGGAPQYEQLLFNTRGSAPTPVEAGVMANRGIIPWDGRGPGVTSFEQAFLEGPWRNKWLPAFRGLAEYLPPPRTVTAMVRAGSLDAATGTALLRKEGLSPQLAAAYIADATHTKQATAKELTESQIVALYEGHVIGQAEAVRLLGHLGLAQHDAQLVLSAAGVRVQVASVNSAVSRVKASFLARHIDAAQAKHALTGVGVTAAQADELTRIWTVELGALPKRLTDAQIVAAEYYGIIGTREAVTRLEHDGYATRDARIVLAVRHKGTYKGIPSV